MPIGPGGSYNMNPQQASAMGGAPPVAAPQASPEMTVTITGPSGGPYMVDDGTGAPPQNAPDFETAMAQAGQALGESSAPADPTAAPTDGGSGANDDTGY